MKKLIDTFSNPSGWDSISNYLGEITPDGVYVVMGRNRDSDILTESNWHCALEELGGEGESVMIYRFGHWACGWLEYLCVLENTPAYAIGADIVKRIEDYPVLDEGDWSERKRIAADEVWKDCYSPRERIEYIRKSGGADFHSFRDLMECVRGNYAPFTNDGYCGLIN